VSSLKIALISQTGKTAYFFYVVYFTVERVRFSLGRGDSSVRAVAAKTVDSDRESDVSKSKRDNEITMDRRERATERRTKTMAVAVDRRKLERRVKVPRRRQIDPTTCERDYTDDEVEFMNAMNAYKRTSGRMFPTCSEVLEVLRGLGYTKQEMAVMAESH